MPTRKQFVELVNSYLKIATTTQDLVEEDAVYNEVVLNLQVRDDVVSVIKLNPPYDLMVDLEKITFGAEPAHNFELLSSIADWLFSNKIADAFRLPQLDTESIRLQRLQPSYTY